MSLWRSSTVPVISEDERSDNEPLLRLELNARAAQSLITKALYAYSVAKQRNPYSAELAPALADALLDIDGRLEQGLVTAGLPPTRTETS